MMSGNLEVKLYVDNKKILPLSTVFDKKVSLEYFITHKDNSLISYLSKVYLFPEWWVNNTGTEASLAEQVKFQMQNYKDKRNCKQTTAYNGLHFMLFIEKNKNIRIKYPLIINDDSISVKVLWKNNG